MSVAAGELLVVEEKYSCCVQTVGMRGPLNGRVRWQVGWLCNLGRPRYRTQDTPCCTLSDAARQTPGVVDQATLITRIRNAAGGIQARG